MRRSARWTPDKTSKGVGLKVTNHLGKRLLESWYRPPVGGAQRRRYGARWLVSIQFLKSLRELPSDVVDAGGVDPQPGERGKAAFGRAFWGEAQTDCAPIVVGRVVSDVDEVVRHVGCRGRQTTPLCGAATSNKTAAPADVQTHAPPCLCATLSRDSRSDGVQGPHERIGGRPGPEATKSLIRSNLQRQSGGEAGIRTLGRGLCPFNGLANRRLQPLGHLTASAVREPAGAGRKSDYTPMWPVLRPPGAGRSPDALRTVTR